MRLVCEPSDDGRALFLEFAYAEAGGSVVSGAERLLEDPEGLHTGDLWKIEERYDDPITDAHRLVLFLEGEDNGRSAAIRNLLTLEEGELTITKLVKYADSTEWLQRHQYRLQRENRE